MSCVLLNKDATLGRYRGSALRVILSACTLRKGSFMDSACKSPTLLAEVMANKKENFKVRNLRETSSRGSNGCIDNASNTLVKSQGGQL